jgi:hypothetical protein
VPVDLIADRDRLIQVIRMQLKQGVPAVVVIDTLNPNSSENKTCAVMHDDDDAAERLAIGSAVWMKSAPQARVAERASTCDAK